MKYEGLVELTVTGPIGDFETRTDQLMDALLTLEDLIDPDIGGNLTEGRMDITMTIEADTIPDAAYKSLCAVRTAIHAVGGATPGWERLIQKMTAEARQPADA
ncbi:hypothetical protein FF36_00870 [Frankia torreyi]|uniref:Uncharacterized protein n=1 Tax=Frankia torreyi TaxID=1856 RepID=A0A0D8BKT8_9ACTN|nr:MULTISPECIES: hypothetical protein [Frankia]KJE24863.1 hypothetical protein FF36_00870 [Frankia torreyi]KQC39236.1 hypothetical protein UK82_06230 [Frankia sp. ACN1ag]